MSRKEIMLRAFQSMAIADAFGYQFEFSDPTVRTVELALEGNNPLGVTDDTQMALYGLEGLSKAVAYPFKEPAAICNAVIRPEYLAWYETQAKVNEHRYVTWLSRQSLMQASRAPGHTCMGSLRQMYMGRDGDRPTNDSKGNGAVMRCLPFVFAPWILGVTEDVAAQIALHAGKITHDHIESQEACNIFMWMAARLLHDGDLTNDTVFDLEKIWPQYMTNVFVPTVREICVRENTFTAIPALKAAMTAFADALSLKNDVNERDAYEHMLIECCANKGDSDTIGAIAGALWGLVANPPAHLLARLRERDIITEVVSNTPVRDDVAAPVASGQEIQPQ